MSNRIPEHVFLPYDLVFVMDPYDSLNLATETSLLLMDSLLARGHRVFWLDEHQLQLQQDKLFGLVRRVHATAPLELAAPQMQSLDEADAVLIRKDPPFDTGYLALSYLFDHLAPTVLQLNPAKALRNFNEKLLPLRWPELMPPSLVSQSEVALLDFLRQQQQIVLKPLDDCSGRGIVRIRADEADAMARIRAALSPVQGKLRFLQAQRFLPEVSDGDKRVYLVDGEVVGLVNRLPAPGNFLANIHQGGLCEATELTTQERSALEKVAPFLREQGLFLAGVDFIGGYLTEVNITSPSAVRQINRVMGQNVEERITDRILARLADHRQKMLPGTATEPLLSTARMSIA